MIFRLLFKFTENQRKNQDFKEHKLLTIRVLIIVKDQLIIKDQLHMSQEIQSLFQP